MTSELLKPERDPDAAGSRLTPRLMAGILVIVLLGELSGFSYILAATALPGIAAHFNTTSAEWTMTVGGLAAAVIVGVVGKLADLRGKRAVLAILIVLSTVGCVLSAVAPNYALFLAGRALQGFLFVIPAMAYSLIRDVFPKKTVTLAAAMTFTGAGPVFVLGPFLAGWMVDSYGALSIFWFSAIFQTVCLIGMFALIPESPIRVPAKLDWPGAILFGVGGMALVFAMGNGARWGWTSLLFFGVILAGLACIAGWLLWDRSFSDPLIDFPLLRSKPMWTTLLVTFITFCIAGPVTAIIPTILQTPSGIDGVYGFGLTATGSAVYMAPLGAGLAASGIVIGAGAARWGLKVPMLVGFGFFMVSLIGLSFLPNTMPSMITMLVLFGIGNGITTAILPNLMMQAVPITRQAIGSVMGATVSTLAGAFLIQGAFVILAAHMFSTADGYFYGSAGYKTMFLMLAGLAVAGALAALVMPHGRRRDVLEAKTGIDEALKEAEAIDERVSK